MKALVFFLVISLFGCGSQSKNSVVNKIEFEVVNHFQYQLISSQFQIVDTQEKMDAIFSIIHKNSVGPRFPPIHTVSDQETYLVFKTPLKNFNDVEIVEVSLEGKTLHIYFKEIDNPQLAKTSRLTPNVLIKILKKIEVHKLVLHSSK